VNKCLGKKEKVETEDLKKEPEKTKERP